MSAFLFVRVVSLAGFSLWLSRSGRMPVDSQPSQLVFSRFELYTAACSMTPWLISLQLSAATMQTRRCCSSQKWQTTPT